MVTHRSDKKVRSLLFTIACHAKRKLSENNRNKIMYENSPPKIYKIV